ncbi:MAG TPA: glycosyltransferase family 4 protein [Lentisphaeria bacterium]|nr:glycosyltransferase family 4 protein [Lentisphaeria bacterium]
MSKSEGAVAKRFLLINYEFPPLGGGAGNATMHTARELARQGHDVRVLSSRFRGQPRNETVDGYHIRRIPVMRGAVERCSVFEMLTFMLSSGTGVLSVTRGWRPDLTIAYFGIPGGPAAWWLRLIRGVPYVVSLRGGDVPGMQPQQLRRQHQLTAPFIRFLWRRATAVVANSAGLADMARKADLQTQISIIPSGVDTAVYCPPARSEAPNGRLLYVGRLSFEKGLDVLLEALSTLKELDWTLKIVGDGPELAALTAQAQQLGLAGRVEFSGWCERAALPAAYQGADGFVFPSRAEGLPNALLEAMACGLPVVATQVSGSEDIVVDGENGCLVPAEDAAALAAGIRELLESRKGYGPAARKHVQKHFCWEAAAAAYARLAPRP